MAEMNTLERLASGKTVVHRLPPIVKFFATLIYLVAVISFNRYEIFGLMPFFFYPAILMALSETPYRPLLKRLVFALPFVLLAGLANLIYDRETAFLLAGTAVSYGLLSFFSVVLKAVLSVMAVLILVSTTSLRDLSRALRKAKVPSLFVDLLVLSYRYLSVLLAEAGTMYTAYLLRSPAAKGIRLRHMG
ncbi:MAG: energy-coupling factor transporter transmembrane component T, partial [Syntrophomonadaceae bacterium]|nr:energy-coupling factor transporter transmembrane component T [Syntrophomonadaceae bacterium]